MLSKAGSSRPPCPAKQAWDGEGREGGQRLYKEVALPLCLEEELGARSPGEGLCEHWMSWCRVSGPHGQGAQVTGKVSGCLRAEGRAQRVRFAVCAF